MRKPMLWSLALTLLILLLPLTARAEETGSLRVYLGREGAVISGGSVTLYRVGLPIAGGYRLEDSFGGGAVAWEDIFSQNLAAWLAEQARFEGTRMQLDADGYAAFPELVPGLYLLIQEEAVPGYLPMEPFLVELPYDGEWSLQANPRQRPQEAAPPTGDSALPIAACLLLPFSGLGIALLVRRRERPCGG